MRFSLFILAAAAAVSAAPLPKAAAGVGAAAVAVTGVACSFQAEQCQKIGNAVKDGIADVGAESVSRSRTGGDDWHGLANHLTNVIGGAVGGSMESAWGHGSGLAGMAYRAGSVKSRLDEDIIGWSLKRLGPVY
ncbi:hypothetical protein Dda_9353 [Drechslerella dactyloides]|uniref:Uncharacterized protein n=1 Tax=Drechslerella dactyloides TaxID=74499 RepID=A0AAD6NF65_DREDA|nr:hypothetical protein Dda_9353 [Drechslerella dactyloides]